jgi:ubiquinone/menaquinone biosynthesis C-methylase UbiE
MARDWVSFWDTSHAIYVNDRHKAVHDRLVTDHLVRLIERPGLAVLDYGCGDTFEAHRLAAACGALTLSDAAPNVLARVATRYPDLTCKTPETVAALPDGSFDHIFVVSVLQYLDEKTLDGLLVLFRRLLRADGALILGDVLPPDLSMVDDVSALLKLAAAHGFLTAALAGLARTFFSDYRKIRGELGLSHHAPADLAARLARLGYGTTRLPQNIGHNQKRYSLRATPL